MERNLESGVVLSEEMLLEWVLKRDQLRAQLLAIDLEWRHAAKMVDAINLFIGPPR